MERDCKAYHRKNRKILSLNTAQTKVKGILVNIKNELTLTHVFYGTLNSYADSMISQRKKVSSADAETVTLENSTVSHEKGE